MVYSVDRAYLEYCICAAEGKYDQKRGQVILISLVLALLTPCRMLIRLLELQLAIAKLFFYLFDNKRVKSKAEELLLTAAAFIFQPLLFLVYMSCSLIGFFSPKASYLIMIAVGTPFSEIKSYEKFLKYQYKAPHSYQRLNVSTKSFLSQLFANRSWPVKISMMTIINEFSHALESGIVAPLAFMKKFHLFDANPLHLKDEQKNLIPILLLNGNYSHQGTFLPLLYALKNKGNQRPVYTLNLPPNYRESQLILEKIEEIKNQYESSSFQIDMIGHSMGSNCIQHILKREYNFKVNRLITLGSPVWLKKLRGKKVFDITAKNDLIIFDKSRIKCGKSKIEIDTGHLGLLYDQTSLDAVLSFLNI